MSQLNNFVRIPVGKKSRNISFKIAYHKKGRGILWINGWKPNSSRCILCQRRVEQGEALLDGLRREIFEESGISVEPEAVTGIYQNLACKKGFGPLEGMTLPTTVNIVFRCRYVSGKEFVSDGFQDVGWFKPEEALQLIRHPYMKKAFEDANGYNGKPHFATFRKADRDIEFVSDCII